MLILLIWTIRVAEQIINIDRSSVLAHMNLLRLSLIARFFYRLSGQKLYAWEEDSSLFFVDNVYTYTRPLPIHGIVSERNEAKRASISIYAGCFLCCCAQWACFCFLQAYSWHFDEPSQVRFAAFILYVLRFPFFVLITFGLSIYKI